MNCYQFLEPLPMGKTILKNRIILTAMAKYLCHDGIINDDYIAHYATLARGGAALVVPGYMIVDPTWPYHGGNQPYLSDDRFIPGLTRLVDVVHAAGAKLACQLWHPGLVGTVTPDSPGISVNDLSLDDIAHIQTQYVDAARRCKQAGADGVEFHLAHTYLPCQFMSPYFNHRTDRYGSAAIEDSMRFSTECIERIVSELCDDHFFITAKINGSDFVEGGITPDWAAAGAVLLEQAGICLIIVNGGGVLTKITGMSDNGHEPEGWKVPFAQTVKQAVSIPVAACGSIRHPAYASSLIAEGRCDAVAIARGIYADPDWVNKAATGRESEIRNCISCLYCLTPIERGMSGCSINPFAKREFEQPPLVRDGDGRVVAIIGAGPAGLEAAVTMGERGFTPVIFDKKPQIGGQMVLAAKPPFKQKLSWMIDYYQRQLDRLGIEAHLCTEATPKMLHALSPYAVVVAVGSDEAVPPIKGIEAPQVIGACALLEKELVFHKKRIVVLGGGMTGVETARLLRSLQNEVTILEMASAPNAPAVDKRLSLGDAAAEGVLIFYRHRAVRVDTDGVEAVRLDDGATIFFAADLIVTALGVLPNHTLTDQLSSEFERVYAIGDCADSGRLSDAVVSGSKLGYAL